MWLSEKEDSPTIIPTLAKKITSELAKVTRVHFAYSLRQLRVGISPPYALDPYDRSRNVL